MKRWLFKTIFKSERNKLIRAIHNRESIIRVRNIRIAILESWNNSLRKEISDLKELIADKK